jgi:acetoacetate decarboxylase
MMTSSGYFRRLAKLIAPGGWIYENAHYLVAEVEFDPRAARRFVPAPLRIRKDAIASLFCAYFPHNTYGSVYREAGLFLPVAHLGKRAIYSPWMIVDDDVALIVGRELCGYPKKLGEIAFEIDGDRIRSVAHRRGAELIHMEGVLKERIVDPPPIIGQPHRNVRSSLGVAVPKLIAFTPEESPIEVRRAELEVRIQGSERDPLHELGFGRVRTARLHRVNIGAGGVPVPMHAVSPAWFLRQLLFRVH